MHTPGPWEALPDTAIYGDGKLVAYAMGAGNIPLEEIYANSRLIAAAPELLEALKTLRADWRKADHGVCDCPLCKADAAIAKATKVEVPA